MALKGKTALVTGSTSGIGHAIAMRFASDGANIVLNGFGDQATIDQIKKEIAAKGVKVIYSGADMSKPDEIAAMVAEAEKQFGAIDVLVNNAGIQYVAPIEEFPIDKWNQIIAINLSAAFHTIRVALPKMKAKGWGRIINIASAHAQVASPFKVAYIAAKHGIAGITRTVALETATAKVTCNAICPGYVWTPLVEKQIPDLAKSENITLEQAKRQVLARQPTNRFVTVDEVAALTAFLASEEAASITGANYSIDGGWTAQ
jgi:3-hydroxybutyrate dehydrogenase